MAKIRLTESELTKLIYESVKEALNEGYVQGEQDSQNPPDKNAVSKKSEKPQAKQQPKQDPKSGGVRGFARRVAGTWKQGREKLDSLQQATRTNPNAAAQAGQAMADRNGGWTGGYYNPYE